MPLTISKEGDLPLVASCLELIVIPKITEMRFLLSLTVATKFRYHVPRVRVTSLADATDPFPLVDAHQQLTSTSSNDSLR